MLIIRLSRHGRKKRPFYRVVLTEHSKPIQSGYKEVLGWFDPLAHKLEVDLNAIKSWIQKGSQLSDRVAKLLFDSTKDDMFKKFFDLKDRVRKKRNASEEEEIRPGNKEKMDEVKVVMEEKKEEKIEEKKEETSE